MNVLAVIPSRYASSRFPAKPLAMLAGKSMIQRVYEQTVQVKGLQQVVVATDDNRIFDHVKGFGGAVKMTSDQHPSGTDRCAEVAADFSAADLVVNIQGDEPFLAPSQIERLIEALKKMEGTGIATLAKKIDEVGSLLDPSTVKVVFDKAGKAMYFSRSVIPHLRGKEQADYLKYGNFYKHIGIYGFYRKTLLEVSKLAPSELELSESLEQLRWLENGYAIQVAVTELETIGVDTPEDLVRAEAYLRGR